MSKGLEIKLRFRNVGAEYSFHYSPVNRNFESNLICFLRARPNLNDSCSLFYFPSYFHNNERLVYHNINEKVLWIFKDAFLAGILIGHHGKRNY